jgi:hypothetical protein
MQQSAMKGWKGERVKTLNKAALQALQNRHFEAFSTNNNAPGR